MRRLGFIGAVIAALLLPATGRAQVTLGARVGYGFGFGDVGGSLAMGDWVNGQVPLQVDALYRVNPRLALGLYYSYGFAQVDGDAAGACDVPGADCTATVKRVGVQGTYAFAPRRRITPWAGANVGYEWNAIESSDPSQQPSETSRTTFKGWEYLGLQGGADLQLGAKVAAGPFLAVSISRYGEGETPGSSVDGSESIDEKKLHGWLTLGLRGRFDF